MMLYRILLWICFSLFVLIPKAQVSFHASDTALEHAFNWARQTAFSYRGDPKDPVGPWYESALPPRYAFCMRDVSHMCMAAEILGMSAENRNMVGLFVRNISASKDWCSYWEINKWGVPAPADYRNDKEFWYNLNANFDLMNACWRLYQWTGDRTFISDSSFLNFHRRSTHEYIDRWVLQADSLLTRPLHPNAPQPFNGKDAFHASRGLPSYSEGVDDLRIGVDLIAAIYRGLMTYADILEANGRKAEAPQYRTKAEQYRKHIDAKWWNEKNQRYYTHQSENGEFGNGEGETFLFWFNVLQDQKRIQKTISYLAAGEANVENRSYYPLIFCEYGYAEQARKQILSLANPATKRREYPEVSYGIVEGVVQGLMGIRADAARTTIASMFRGMPSDKFNIANLPVMQGAVTIMQEEKKTSLENNGRRAIEWQPGFAGKHASFVVGGKTMKSQSGTDKSGNMYSFIKVQVKPGQTMEVSIR